MISLAIVLLCLVQVLCAAEEEKRVGYRTKIEKKQTRLQKFLKKIADQYRLPDHLKPEPWCKPHRTGGNVIIAAAMSVDWGRKESEMFMKTLRATGYKEDVVVAVMEGSQSSLIGVLKQYDAIVYSVKTTCDENGYIKVQCTFDDFPTAEAVSINMLRFHLNKWLASVYSSNSLVMISDFRDVLFQSNPFVYRTKEWAGTATEPKFVAFQEPFPQRVIYRCPFNGQWIKHCYGKSGIALIGGNTVSCSGVSIATRDAIIAYAYLVLQQLRPEVRWGKDTKQSNRRCISTGMDQGFHNWLVFSGSLERFMDVKVYQQGEGPVNTVGSFFPGKRTIHNFTLEQWRVVRGSGNQKAFYNWNNEISPVVHQLDRFHSSTFQCNYGQHLTYAHGVSGPDCNITIPSR